MADQAEVTAHHPDRQSASQPTHMSAGPARLAGGQVPSGGCSMTTAVSSASVYGEGMRTTHLILTCPAWLMSRLAGLMSRWICRLSCRKARPCSTCPLTARHRHHLLRQHTCTRPSHTPGKKRLP